MKPSRERIGWLSGEASTWRYRKLWRRGNRGRSTVRSHRRRLRGVGVGKLSPPKFRTETRAGCQPTSALFPRLRRRVLVASHGTAHKFRTWLRRLRSAVWLAVLAVRSEPVSPFRTSFGQFFSLSAPVLASFCPQGGCKFSCAPCRKPFILRYFPVSPFHSSFSHFLPPRDISAPRAISLSSCRHFRLDAPLRPV